MVKSTKVNKFVNFLKNTICRDILKKLFSHRKGLKNNSMSKVTEKSKMSGRHKNRPVGLTFKYFVSVLMCRHLYKVQVVVR